MMRAAYIDRFLQIVFIRDLELSETHLRRIGSATQGELQCRVVGLRSDRRRALVLEVRQIFLKDLRNNCGAFAQVSFNYPPERAGPMRELADPVGNARAVVENRQRVKIPEGTRRFENVHDRRRYRYNPG
jgi:hypothetical protein